MNLIRQQYSGCGLLLREDYTEIINCDWFETNFWQTQNKITGQAKGRGNTVFFENSGVEYVLRHYLRGGKVAKITKDKYFFAGFEKTRPFLEMRLNHDLYQQGLPVAQPIAARVTKQGLFYTGDFISLKIPASVTLYDYVNQKPDDVRIWSKVGSMLKRLHTAGLNHADLNVRNILTSGENVYLIDFDKSALNASKVAKESNLVRLKRSLQKELIFSPENYTRLLESYNENINGYIK